VDLTRDGKPDVISGSWPGEIYLFENLGDRRFAAPRRLKHQGGKLINVGNAAAVFAADWDRDGDLDLLIGDIDGQVHLVLRSPEGYGAAHKLKAGGKTIKVPQGDAGPCVADWDGDGRDDLLVGAGDGSVYWFRNVGTRTEPELAEGRDLVGTSTQMTFRPTQDPKARPRPWGSRAKIAVTDWNGDGRLDLLLGDFSTYAVPPDEKITAERMAIQRRLTPLARKLHRLRTERRRLKYRDAADAAETRARLARLEKEIEALQEAMRADLQALEKLPRPGGWVSHGHVWLFLRKPPAASD